MVQKISMFHVRGNNRAIIEGMPTLWSGTDMSDEKGNPCPFWRRGARCVLAPEVREFRNCGKVACQVVHAMSVTLVRPEEKPS